MKVSHGLFADACKAAISWRTEIYTLPLESIVQPIPGLAFFMSEEALDLGHARETILISCVC